LYKWHYSQTCAKVVQVGATTQDAGLRGEPTHFAVLKYFVF